MEVPAIRCDYCGERFTDAEAYAYAEGPPGRLYCDKKCALGARARKINEDACRRAQEDLDRRSIDLGDDGGAAALPEAPPDPCPEPAVDTDFGGGGGDFSGGGSSSDFSGTDT